MMEHIDFDLLVDPAQELLTDNERRVLDMGKQGFTIVDVSRASGEPVWARFVSFVKTVPSDEPPLDSKLVRRAVAEGRVVW